MGQKTLGHRYIGLSLLAALSLGLLCGCDSTQQISPRSQRAYELSLATFDDRLGIAWNGGEDAHNALYLRFTDPHGLKAGSAIALTDATREAYEPDLQVLAGDPLIAWYEVDRASKARTAVLARFTPAGKLKWRRELSNPGKDGRNPVARIAGNDIAVAWIETDEIDGAAVCVARYDENGEVLVAAKRMSPASRDTWSLNADVDDRGTFYVVYDARIRTHAKELILLRMDDKKKQRFTLSGNDGFDSSDPDIAFRHGRIALTWFDTRDGNEEIYLFTGGADELSARIDQKARRVTHSPGSSIGATVAWNRSQVALAWSEVVGQNFQIFTQTFADDGSPLGNAKQLTDGEHASVVPAIRPWRRGFAVAWNTYDMGKPGATHGKIESSKGMMEVFP